MNLPAPSVGALRVVAPELREAAVTQYLTDAHVRLALALETTDPQIAAQLKAEIATVAEATKQLGLSKSIKDDAAEMVRRAERALGIAIRKGQEEGTVNTQADGPTVRDDLFTDKKKMSPQDFLTAGTTAVETYVMADVDDQGFERAVTAAKAEGNLSRANVVRKIRDEDAHLSGQQRLDRIAELADRGMTSAQIGKEIGHTTEYIRRLARNADIIIPADRTLGKVRHINHTKVAEQTVIALEALASGLQVLDLSQVDPGRAGELASPLSKSLRALNRFETQMKELANA